MPEEVQEQPSARARLFPDKKVIYNDVEIIIKPLPVDRIAAFLEAMMGLSNVSTGKDGLPKDWAPVISKLSSFIDESMIVPEDPEIKFTDLPVDAALLVVEAFIDANPFFQNLKRIMPRIMGKIGLSGINSADDLQVAAAKIKATPLPELLKSDGS